MKFEPFHIDRGLPGKTLPALGVWLQASRHIHAHHGEWAQKGKNMKHRLGLLLAASVFIGGLMMSAPAAMAGADDDQSRNLNDPENYQPDDRTPSGWDDCGDSQYGAPCTLEVPVEQGRGSWGSQLFSSYDASIEVDRVLVTFPVSGMTVISAIGGQPGYDMFIVQLTGLPGYDQYGKPMSLMSGPGSSIESNDRSIVTYVQAGTYTLDIVNMPIYSTAPYIPYTLEVKFYADDCPDTSATDQACVWDLPGNGGMVTGRSDGEIQVFGDIHGDWHGIGISQGDPDTDAWLVTVPTTGVWNLTISAPGSAIEASIAGTTVSGDGVVTLSPTLTAGTSYDLTVTTSGRSDAAYGMMVFPG